jgi:hypothetical protein
MQLKHSLEVIRILDAEINYLTKVSLSLHGSTIPASIRSYYLKSQTLITMPQKFDLKLPIILQ